MFGENGMIRLVRGSTIVFEGLDATGKSTQIERLRARVVGASTEFVHMPTGFDAFAAALRRTLEDPNTKPRHALAKQLAHLACHAESMPDLVRIRSEGALVLDRWWWSTIAYGWNVFTDSSLSRSTFEELVTSIWLPVPADQIFLFLSPHKDDANNDPAIVGKYRELANEAAVFELGIMTEDQAHTAVVDQLLDRGLAVLA